MTRGDRNEYKRTFFDKHGPDAALSLEVLSFIIVPIIAGAGIGAGLAIRAARPAVVVAVFTLIGAVIGGAGYWVFVMGFSRGAARVFGGFIGPSGSHTPFERQFSREDALVMRGHIEGALASYESIILESPTEPQPRIRAAELYARSELRERAETLYRSVQRLPGIAGRDDIFASNRLVDLYLAWPGHETKGLRELRRIIDTYPETEVAERARAGLVKLKSQLGVTE